MNIADFFDGGGSMVTHQMSELSDYSTRISDAGFVSDARACIERDDFHASKAMPQARAVELEMGVQSQGPPMPRPESRAGPPMPRPESAVGTAAMVDHTPVVFPSPEDFQSGSTISESAPDKVAQLLDDDSPVHSSAQAMMHQVTPDDSARRDLMAAEESAASSPAGGSYGGGAYGGVSYG